MKSELVKYIFNYAEKNLNYLILRNYESLPEDEGHDIDFLIDESELYKKNLLISELKERFNIRVFKRQQYYGLCGYAIVIEGKTVLHLDFFTKIQWNRFNFIPTDEALKRKKRYKDCLWVIGDIDLCYYCWINYIRAKGNIKEKYRKLAFLYEEQYNKDKLIDVFNKSNEANKIALIHKLIKNTSFATVLKNTIANIWFKTWKLFYMDGRIYVTDDLDSQLLFAARRYCSCVMKDFEQAGDMHFLDVVKRLYLENSMVVSLSEWKKVKWRFLIPKTYVITDISDLGEIVCNIYRNVEE